MAEPACILVVEDDPHLLCTTTRLLENAGHQVTQAVRGSEAMRLAQTHHPDLVLLDVMLPDIDGLEVCRRIKADPELDNCFVVMRGSAKTSSEDQSTGLEAGADGHIGRPISNRELLARVEAGLRTQRAERHVAHLNQVLRAIQSVNQLIATEKDRDHLVRGACENLIETRGYFDAWIALVDQDGNLSTAAAAGLGRERAALLEQLQQGVFPPCAQQALKHASLVTGDGPGVDCATCILAARPLNRQGIATPLEFRGRILGVLVVSVPVRLGLDGQERALLREVAGDIAFAVHNLKMEAQSKETEKALREERDRAQKYLDIAGVMLVALDVTGAVMLVNRRAGEILGCPQEKITGTNWFNDFVPPRARDQVRSVFERLITGEIEGVEYAEHPVLTRNGEERIVAWHNTVLRDARGNIAGTLSSGEDVTARKQAEEALRDSEQRLRHMFEYAASGIALVNPDGTFAQVNRAYCDMLGYSSEELVGKTFSEVTHPEDRAAGRAVLERQLSGQRDHEQLEKRFIRRDGSVVWTILSTSMLRGAEGEPLYQISQIQDITERKAAETALRNSEARYRTLAESSHDLVWEIDAQGRLTFINTVAQEIYGYMPEEMIGREFVQLIAPEDREQVVRTFREAAASGVDVLHYETREVDRSGEVVILDVHSVVRRDYQGNIIGVSGTSQDITERTRAEEALRESEAQHRTLFETMAQGVVYQDREGQIISANAAAEMLLGLSLDQLLGRTSRDPRWHAIHEDGSDFLGETHPSIVALRTGQEIRNVVMGVFNPQAGAYRWLNIHATPLFRAGESRPYRVYTTFDDMTARRQAEQERERLLAQIRGQARQMQQVLAAVPEGVLLVDGAGRVLQANPTAEKDLVRLAGARVGDRITQLGDRALTEILTSPPTQGLWHQVHVDQRTFDVISRPVENGAEPEHWVLVINDVTRERQVRAQLQQQERLAAVGQLAAGIAHDFNNIIGTIILYARLVEQSQELSERDRERLGLVSEQAWHATRLIEQILDFSRRSVLERRPLDLLPLLKEQRKLLERTLPEHIRIELSYGQEEYTVHADPTRMQQMLTNLAVNARDAMPGGGTLHFELARVTVEPGHSPLVAPIMPGEWIRLVVSDTGTGIPPEALSHIFEPFFTTKEPGEGTGLGLAQVHGIIGQHEGHIGVETQMGEGTTFTIYLPALKVRPAGRAAPGIAAAPQGNGELVLIVEDEATLRGAMTQVLTLLNYHPLEAKNGQDALELMHEQGDKVALVLSDVVMPVMGGIALFHALREQKWTTPVILLTGHPMDKELDALSQLGLAAWMTKPPSLERLANVIKATLETGRGSTEHGRDASGG